MEMKKILVLLPILLVTSKIMGMDPEKIETMRQKTYPHMLTFANTSFILGDYENSLSVAQILTRQSDKKMKHEANVIIAMIYINQDKLDDAKKKLEKVAKQKLFKKISDYAKEKMLNLGFKYEVKGDYETALSLYQRASEQNYSLNTKYLAFNNIGELYSKQNKLEEAIVNYDKAINQNTSILAKHLATHGKSSVYKKRS